MINPADYTRARKHLQTAEEYLEAFDSIFLHHTRPRVPGSHLYPQAAQAHLQAATTIYALSSGYTPTTPTTPPTR